jgi:hypothetical protein
MSIGSANLWHGVQFQCERQPKRGRPDARQSIYLAGQDVSSSNAITPPRRWDFTNAGRTGCDQYDGATILIQPRSMSSAGFSRSIGLSGLPVSPDNTESLSVIGMGSYPLSCEAPTGVPQELRCDWSPERPGKHAIIGVRPKPRSDPRHGRRIFNRVSSDRRNEHSGGGHKKMNRTRFSAIRAAVRRHEALIPCRVGTQ